MSTEEVMAVLPAFLEKAFPVAKGLFLVPTIDNYMLKENYTEAIDKMTIKDIPYMLGCTADDILVTPEMKEKGPHSPLYDGCLAFCKKISEAGRKPAFMYYFTRRLPGDENGAFHSSELWYMFGTVKRCWRPLEKGDYALSEQMLDYWTNFMKYGDPNGETEGRWKPCCGDEKDILELNLTEL